MPFLLIPLFAGADRLSGSSLRLPGRQVWWAGLILTGALALMRPLWAPIGLLWFFPYREPAWGILGGSIAPKTFAEIVDTIGRHLLALPAFAYVAWLTGHWLLAPLAAFAFAAAATALGVVNARYSAKGKDVNWIVETARGAVFGILAGLLLWAAR